MSRWSPSIPDTDIHLLFWSNALGVRRQTSAVQISWFAEAIVLLKNDSLKKASPVIVKYQTSPVIVDCFPVFRLSFTVSCEALSVDTHMNVGVQLFLESNSYVPYHDWNGDKSYLNFIQLGLQKFICTLFLSDPPLHLGIVASLVSLELELQSNDLGLERVKLQVVSLTLLALRQYHTTLAYLLQVSNT